MDIGAIKRDLDGLTDLIKAENDKWMSSRWKCKTWNHISKTHIRLGVFSRTAKTMFDFIILMMCVDDDDRISTRSIANCFRLRKIKSNTETKLELLKKKKRANKLWGNITQSCLREIQIMKRKKRKYAKSLEEMFYDPNTPENLIDEIETLKNFVGSSDSMIDVTKVKSQIRDLKRKRESGTAPVEGEPPKKKVKHS